MTQTVPESNGKRTVLPSFCPRVILLFVAATVSLLLGACVPRIITEYRIDVQQGNVLTQETVSRLQPGMTRHQVKALLGTPMLSDIFHADRWDYPYSLQDGYSGKIEKRFFSVFFDKNGKLIRVAGDVEPLRNSPANQGEQGGETAPTSPVTNTTPTS